jgi:predicted extracellular nuclease
VFVTAKADALHSTQLKAYVQDASGMGVQIYASSISSDQRTAFVRGNTVTITGTVTEYVPSGYTVGTTEITSPVTTVTGTAPLPEPLDVTTLTNPIAYEGTFLKVRGLVTDFYATGTSGYNVTLSAGGSEWSVRIWNTTGIDVSSIATGNTMIIKGIGGIYQDMFQILPVAQTDLAVDTTDTGIVVPDDSLTSIYDIQTRVSEFDGTIVTIEGVITVPFGAHYATRTQVFIQDASGRGLELFGYSVPSNPADFVRGSRLRVRGEVDEYNGGTEIKNFTYTYLGTDTLPTPAMLTMCGQMRLITKEHG